MRRFADRTGFEWDVVPGRESWGANVALFVPVAGAERAVRQAMLTAVSTDAAYRELDAMSEVELQLLLDRSAPKEEGYA